jgi:DNA adenine methylase
MNSIISWVGGKRILRKKILPLIPKHDIYCEVFGGAAWILFGKSANKEDWQLSKKSRYTEVYNDINGDLVNFWKYIKNHPEAFVTELNQYLVSRELFEEFARHEFKTELERAVRFYFQLSCSYGSRSKNFCIMQGYKYMPLRQLEKVKAASERLQQVIIEKQDFEKILKRYDTPNSFFYLDPPYYTKEHLYNREDADAFTKHEELASALKNNKGKFLLSYNNDPHIRTLYQGFTIDEVEAQITVSGAFKTEAESLISGI